MLIRLNGHVKMLQFVFRLKVFLGLWTPKPYLMINAACGQHTNVRMRLDTIHNCRIAFVDICDNVVRSTFPHKEIAVVRALKKKKQSTE